MPHSREQMDVIHTRRGNALTVAAIAVVFLALRIALLATRDPFFDELFTAWIAAKPSASILQALGHDSGPPLYYLFVHALGLRSITAIRLLSLAAGAAALGLLFAARSLGGARFAAAALVAVYPASVLFAADARAYALAALSAAAGLVLLWRFRLFAAAMAFVIAGYCHYYGALFLPLLLLPLPGAEGLRAPRFMRRLGAAAGGAVLYLPAVALALSQPREAMGWLREPRLSFAGSIAFAGKYAYGLFASAPSWLVITAGLVLLACLAFPLVHALTEGLYRFAAAATLVPLFLAVAAGVYFPLRFDSIVAVPLALWIAASVAVMPRVYSRAFFAFFLVAGLATTYLGIVDHAQRPIDPYRAAATWVARNVPPDQTVVASGYCYLETVTATQREVIAFPPEQSIHPGWRAFPRRSDAIPPKPFVWIGERNAPELQLIRRSSSIRPLYANETTIVAFVR